MKDMDLWRHWKNGKNTFEIARITGLKEHEVEPRIHKLRAEVRGAARKTRERELMFQKYFSELAMKKRGFTGRETISGYPRGC